MSEEVLAEVPVTYESSHLKKKILWHVCTHWHMYVIITAREALTNSNMKQYERGSRGW